MLPPPEIPEAPPHAAPYCLLAQTLMDLVKLSDQHPQDAINLLSARHWRFVLEAGPPGPRQAALARLYYILWQEMTKMLNQSPARDLPGPRK